MPHIAPFWWLATGICLWLTVFSIVVHLYFLRYLQTLLLTRFRGPKLRTFIWSNNISVFVPNLSPWPLFNSIGLVCLLGGAIGHWHEFSRNVFLLGLICMIVVGLTWVADVRSEALYGGDFTESTFGGLRLGVVLFILSEVFFFFSFFWCQFDEHWVPGVLAIPMGAAGVPVINTLLLLSSGVVLTWAHESVIKGRSAFIPMGVTLFLGWAFFLAQCVEYSELPLGFCDGPVFARFFLITGFHGSHVVIGLTLLTMITIHMFFSGVSSLYHMGFEGAAWYWHFVDVVWLFLFLLIYDPSVADRVAGGGLVL